MDKISIMEASQEFIDGKLTREQYISYLKDFADVMQLDQVLELARIIASCKP